MLMPSRLQPALDLGLRFAAWLGVDEQFADDPHGRLMGRVATGDDTALQQLFDEWKRPLLSFFYRSLGSHADAEDLTLEVFVRLHRAASSYRPKAKFSTYLFQIAQNLACNEARRRSRKPADAAPAELFETLPTPTTDNARLEALEDCLRFGLAQLPERDRAALLLVHQQEMDYADAAATLGLSENALRVALHRARKRLKDEMKGCR